MTEHPIGPPDARPPTNLRKHRQRTDRNLILGGFLILFVVGGGLVWYFYGLSATLASWACLGSAAILYGMLQLILKLVEIRKTPR